MIKTYKYDSTEQLSEHFSAQEFRCKCGKAHDFRVSEELVAHLESLRAALGCSSVHVSSGYRCPEHDKAVGGKGNGKHTQGLAADVICYAQQGLPISSKVVSCKAQDLGFRGIANITAAYTSTHLDMRDGTTWYGDETRGTAWACADLHEYYGIPREEEEQAMAKKGIDISYCQKKVDWAKVTGVEFVILRAGYGKYDTQKDSMFESHYAGAKKAGIPVGAYWYSYAKTEDDARKEADVCIKTLAGKQYEYPIYYDVEEKTQLDLGKEKVSAIIRAFLERVEAAGYWVGLYMSASPLSTLVEEDILKRYAVWVAHVNVSKPAYGGGYGLWQYSWKGSIPGIDGDVDCDYAYVDYPAKIKEKGLNGYGKPPEPDPQPKTITVEMIVDGVTYGGTLTEI